MFKILGVLRGFFLSNQTTYVPAVVRVSIKGHCVKIRNSFTFIQHVFIHVLYPVGRGGKSSIIM